MNVTIKKVGWRDGEERFVLIHAESRRVLTVHDVSERTLRRFFLKRGMSQDLINQCVVRARENYAAAKERKRPPVNQSSETSEDHDLLFELGLEGDSDAGID